MILSVQPFGLGSPGGGSRILRALLHNAELPHPWMCVATSAFVPPSPPFGEELHMRCRPFFGRLEHSRFARWPHYLDVYAQKRLETHLDALVHQREIRAIHAIAHECWDTIAAYRIASKNNLPFFLSIHDDPEYALKGHPLKHKFLDKLPRCWNDAVTRFVISEEMGIELCQRWGKKDYVLVTDGVDNIAASPSTPQPNRLAVYFMGMLHLSYEPNFIALQTALRAFADSNPDVKVSLTLRCGGIRSQALVYPDLVKILPFASEAEVAKDLAESDLLYLPLPFDDGNRPLAAFSLSTKMITYLGSGIPILFHGPENSAAGKLLSRNRAAIIHASNNHLGLLSSLTENYSSRIQYAANALELARRQFQLSTIQERFWQPIKVNAIR